MVKKVTQKKIKAVKTVKKPLPKGKTAVSSSIKRTSSNDSVNHVIGKAIAKCRNAADISQEKLAKKLGLRNEAVSRMERGIVIPTVERLIEMAEIFDCPVSDLLTETSNRTTDETMYLYSILSVLNNEDKNMLFEMVEKLSSHLRTIL